MSTDGWDFRPAPPDWALNAWTEIGGWFNVAGSAGTRIERITPEMFGDGYPRRGSEDDQCRPWKGGMPVMWDVFWKVVLATIDPPDGREWRGDWDHVDSSLARIFMGYPNYVFLDDGSGGVWCRRHAPKAPAVPTKGPAQLRLEELTGLGVHADNPGAAWVGAARDGLWASISPSRGRVTIWRGGSIEAACAELLRRHDEGIDPLPCQRAEVPEGWESVSAPGVASRDLVGYLDALYLLADGRTVNKVRKGEWCQLIQRKAPSLYTEPPGVYLVAFRGEFAKTAEWGGGQLLVHLTQGTQTRSPADVVAWERVCDVDRKPPALGVWLGRAPTVEERKAHAKQCEAGRTVGGDPIGWWATLHANGHHLVVSYTGEGALRCYFDAAPARDASHAKELIEAKRREMSCPDHKRAPDGWEATGEWVWSTAERPSRDEDRWTNAASEVTFKIPPSGCWLLPIRRKAEPKPSPLDPRIGKWCRDRNGVEGLVVGIDYEGWVSLIVANGESESFEDASVRIIPPPDPIPEPCRPAWVAFRALERERGQQREG